MEPQIKTAIVTGAGRGIGRAVALRLAADGLRVCAASLTGERAEAVAAEIEAAGGEAMPFQVDVSQEGSVGRMVEAVLARYGRVDVLVNNAGIHYPAPFEQMTLAQWQRMLDVHLTGSFLCARAVVGPMLAQGSGAIVNIASTSGLTGGASGAHYAAAKGGVIAFTRALSRELAGRGVRVNAVAPSKIETDMLTARTPDELAALAGRIPLGRTGKPAEVAALVAFLASDEASYITGEVIVASGGY
jgi:3-oxoacyl-[acyl-carrier protein] reductase